MLCLAVTAGAFAGQPGEQTVEILEVVEAKADRYGLDAFAGMQEQTELCCLDFAQVDVAARRDPDFPGKQADEMILGERGGTGEIIHRYPLGKMLSDITKRCRDPQILRPGGAFPGLRQKTCKQQPQQPLCLHPDSPTVLNSAGKRSGKSGFVVVALRIEVRQGATGMQGKQPGQDGFYVRASCHFSGQVQALEQARVAARIKINMQIHQIQRSDILIGMAQEGRSQVQESGTERQCLCPA